MNHFSTYFDRDYVGRALVLHNSLTEHAAEFVLWGLCLDDEAFQIVSDLADPSFRPIALADLEAFDPDVVATQSTRTRIEYFFTLTPILPRYVLSLDESIDVVSYLDADLRFYADPQLVLVHMHDASVLIIPHGFPSDLAHLEVYGKYNVGMVSFRRDAAGLACLERWRVRCIEWCYDRVEDDRFADQRYLDDWPRMHDRVAVVDVPGIGLGPWNQSRFTLGVEGGRVTVDGHPLVFYHFHAFKSITAWLYLDGLQAYSPMPQDARAVLYGGYVRDLDRSRALLTARGLGVARSGRRRGRPGLRELVSHVRERHLLAHVAGHVIS